MYKCLNVALISIKIIIIFLNGKRQHNTDSTVKNGTPEAWSDQQVQTFNINMILLD